VKSAGGCENPFSPQQAAGTSSVAAPPPRKQEKLHDFTDISFDSKGRTSFSNLLLGLITDVFSLQLASALTSDDHQTSQKQQ